MELKDDIIICATELTSKKGKMPLFSHILVERLNKEKIPYLVISLVHVGGDYVIQSAKVVIERKTMADFIHTWLHGSKKGKIRLEDQLEKALETYPDAKVILAIEDYYRCLLDYEGKCVWIPTYEYKKGQKQRTVGYYKIGVNPKSLKGKIKALKNRIERSNNNSNDSFNRLEIKKFFGGNHMLEWFLGLMKGSDDKKRTSIKVHRIKKKSANLREQQLFFLEGLPNIGGKTSLRLLNKFKKPIDALLKIKEWKSYPELGRITKPMIQEGARVLGIEIEGKKNENSIL